MERATFKILFYIRKTKKLKDGTFPICARITVNGTRAEFRIQRSVKAKDWNTVNGLVKDSSRDANLLNEELHLIMARLYSQRLELETKGKTVTAESIKNSYLGVEETTRTILQVFKEHNDRCKSLVGIDFAQGTYDRYASCYKHLGRFIGVMYHKTDVKLVEVTPAFIKDFEFYLKTDHKNGSKSTVMQRCGHNSATKYLKNFKKITRLAMTNGWLKEDPFRNTKFHLEKVDLAFLTSEELDRLINTKMTMSRLEQVKDVYLFCCFTGLAFIDVKNLSYADLEEKSGRMWIKKKRQKTKNWCNIPLLSPALQLMEKYKNNPWCQKNNRVFPVLSNQKMNAYIKEIATICKIEKNLSTHTARHTFATTVTLSNQISIEVVSKMLGHSSINMTKRYARVVDDLIQKDMQKIYGTYDGVKIA